MPIHECPTTPMPSHRNLDINTDTAIRPADAIPPEINLPSQKRRGRPIGSKSKKRAPAAPNFCDLPSEPIKLEDPNEIVEISREEWRSQVRTRGQLRNLFDLTRDPTPVTIVQPRLPKRSLSEVDPKDPEPDVLPISSTIKVMDVPLAQNKDGNASKIERDDKQENNRTMRKAEGPIDSRYDPTVMEIKGETYYVPRACHGFFPANFEH